LYVALNTLVFPNELDEVEDLIRLCAAANVDALIVQDLGVARLAQTVAPNLELHASTQQTITSVDGANFIADLMGSTRVVLGRELSIEEIESVALNLQQSSSAMNPNNNKRPPVEVETFVHGALCVSYSGQCFSSEAWGGRSANRGQCAQACRLPYGLIDNGDLKELGDFSYLLSPQDLCGLDHVPALVQAGVACLKIEGRLKDAAYVAATTRAYRNAVDEAWHEYCLEEKQQQQQESTLQEQGIRQLSYPEEHVTKEELAQLFSRGQDETHNGLTPGFFDGSRHQEVVRGRSPRHRGVHVGRVLEGSSWKKGLVVALDDTYNGDTTALDLKRGDGLVVDRGLAQEEELGGPIFDIQTTTRQHGSNKQQRQRVAVIRFSKTVEKKWKSLDDRAWKAGARVVEHAPVGAHVWKTSDATVDKKMKRLSEAPLPKKIQLVAKISVIGTVGEPLVVSIQDQATGRQGVGMTEGVLQPAESKGLESKTIRKAIGTLGNTEWNLSGDVDTTGVEEGVWCPASWIKEARRKAAGDLQSQLESNTSSSQNDSDDDDLVSRKSVSEVNGVKQLLKAFHHDKVAQNNEEDGATAVNSTTTKVSLLARTYAQVDSICSLIERGKADDVDEIIVDFLEVDGMREAVNRIRQLSADQKRVKAVVASPRIIKPGESGIWRTLLRLEPDSLLVRSTGLLHRMMKLGGEGQVVTIGSSETGVSHEVAVPELIGDFSLNVANPLTAWELLTYGCSRVTASYDLNANGITELLKAMDETSGIKNGAGRIEIVAHAHLPIFHTEHCVFARFLSNGNSYLDCGHACTRHNVHLRDQTGADNLVLGTSVSAMNAFVSFCSCKLLDAYNMLHVRLYSLLFS
jgi:putative protease